MTTRREAVTTTPAATLPWTGIGFALLGLMLGAVLILIGSTLYTLQGGVSVLAQVLPFGYAFGAGMVASVNPCGVLMLPSLVAYYLSQGEAVELGGWQRARKAILLAVMATLGFVALFAVVGAVMGLGGHALGAAFPVGGLVVGFGLAALGLWLALTGRGLGVAAASRAMGRVRLGDDLRSLFFFGIAYAVTSLACTLPVFLVVAGSALASGGAFFAAGQFISYALGMGTVLTVVILTAAFFQRTVSNSLRRLMPYVHRLASSFLIGAGIFVVHYWLAALGWL